MFSEDAMFWWIVSGDEGLAHFPPEALHHALANFPAGGGRGIASFPADWLKKSIVNVPAEWLTKSIGPRPQEGR